MSTQRKVWWSICGHFGRLLLAIALVQLVALKVSAQNVLDDTTPPGQAPGKPTGSYAVTGFENVNLFNGHLNFRLPLLKVGGRGGAGFMTSLPIEQRWTVDHDPFTDVYHFPNYNWWTGLRPGYGPGVLQGRQMSEGCNDESYPTQGTTRLTFMASDGTEYELRDQIYGGQAASSNCNPSDPQAPGTSRGTTFVTADGSAATFVSDTTIYDHTYTPSGPNILLPSGYLMLRDGSRYRIDSGLVTWMRDRNGNKLSFTYEGSWMSWRITSATDSLKRQIIYQYNYSDPTYGVCDRIIFKGFGGAERMVRIFRTSLSNALISGESIATYYNLFPTLNGSSSTYHNPDVVSVVRLPDTRTFQFRYNRYGELCRVELPIGGRFEYSWAQFPQGMGFQPEINRRVTERRSYTEGGALASRSTYGSYESDGLGTQGSVQVDHLNFGGGLLSREKHYFHGHPFSYTMAGQFDLPNPIEGREFKTEFFNTNGTTILRRIENTWTTCATLVGTAINPCTNQTISTLEPATVNLVSKQTFSYDSYNNPTSVYGYGFGTGAAGGLVRRTQTDYLTTNPVNGTNYATTGSIHLRSLPKEVQIFDGAGVRRSRATFEYDNYTTDANHAGLVNRTSISGLDASFTTSYTTRGNSTAATHYLLDSSGGVSSSISTYQQFDLAGNLVKSIDGRSYATQFDFTDRFGTPDGNAQVNSGATELGSQVSYAFATKVTNVLSHIAYSQFDYYLGQPVDAEDANGVVSSLYYNDSLDRLTQVRRAVGTGVSNQTTFAYDDSNRIITTSSDRDNFGDNVIVSKMLYDGLGRTTETRQYEGGVNYIVTQQQYDALNRAFKTSNPFRPWQSETTVWTTQAFDALGRLISVTTPDNAVVSTSYSGHSVTVTDQAGKARKSVTDALGRLIEVYEDPSGLNYQTTYNYDVLDNLVKVTQGSQQRFFKYDSLKRLIRARNPEQSTLASLNLSDPLTGNSAWSMGYEYDANSNLTFKTDARGVVTENRYDALNRVTTILYRVNGQPDPNTGDIEFLYDNATNGKGRLWLTYRWGSKPSQTAVGLYDALGRVTQLYNLFGNGQGGWSTGYPINRTYNRAGSITSQTHPSGRTVSYAYDTAGRVNSFTGNLGDGVTRNYATEQNYSAFGALTKEKFGTTNLVYHKLHHNVRGQQCDVRASNVNDEWGGELGALVNFYSTNPTPCASGTDNNGNVLKSQTIINSYYMEDRYSYDSLNRLTAVNEYQNGSTHTGSQQYTYDRWGNRTINPATWGTGINNKQFTVDTATNRLGVPGGQSGAMTYDNAGNLTTDTYTGFGTRVYDADNKMVSAQDNLAGTSYYTYDANGQRVRRKSNTQETWQIYGIDGELVAEYAANGAEANPQKEYGYRNGQLLVTATPASSHSFSGNGTSAYMQAPSSSSLNISGAITVEAWVKINAIGAYRAVISREAFQQSGTGGGYRLTITDTGKVRLDLFQTHNTYVTLIGTTTITPGVWTHVAGVFDGSQMRVYLNGVQNGTLSTTSGPTSGTGNLHIGRFSYSSNPYYFNGLIDDARVSNAALYTSNFTPSNNLTATGSSKGLWKFDGQTANDSSGNGNHGTLQGGATYSTDVPGVGGSPQIQWLVSDHLGTPRIVIDQTGTLANVKRHDYLPFGEELFAGVGGRTTQLGYAPGDGVRQQFTSKERDVETGLDYFINRYYSSIQGRFTSADPVPMTSQRPPDPQRLNLYSYVRNNPLIYTDPNGLELYFELEFDSKGKVKNWSAAKEYRKALEKATGLKLNIDKTTGLVTIKSEPKSLSGVAGQIKTIINDSVNTPVRIGVSNNDPNVTGGQFDGGGHQTLDLADIKKLSKKNGFTKESAVVHETTEAYQGVINPTGTFNQFHSTAIGFENDVRAAQGRAPRGPGPDAITQPNANGDIVVTVDFTTHIERITVNQATPGNIKKVEVLKKTP